MVKKGGGIIDMGLWGLAIRNSDGTVAGTMLTRFWYGLILLGILIVPFALIFLVFGKTTHVNNNNNKNV
jgi:hypothetical protein